MQKVFVNKIATLKGHKDAIYALSSSQYNNFFFSSGAEGYVSVWSIENPGNGTLVAKVPNSVYAMSYATESNLLLIGHNYDGLHFLDWEKKVEKTRRRLPRCGFSPLAMTSTLPF